ncbi:PH domain-like protein [Amniculicola lignicola CBS 123094]|uniref:PH domain-like protein n=1 Tax=Amniculicola lignicola CBS 123094 TaxID=1392246 RepID=A0A6A5WA64_9PLEO|nr:PH domain-like protein [Amniculicola lignicola CBS 123094]
MSESPNRDLQPNGELDVDIHDGSSTPSKAPTSPTRSDSSEKEKSDEPQSASVNGADSRPETALSDSGRHATKRPRDDEDAEAEPTKTKQTKATESSDDEVPETTKKMKETKVTEAPPESKFKASGFSAFASASASPFGAGSGSLSSFASPKKPTSVFAAKPEAGNELKTSQASETTSSSAFKSSGFSAFASASASPFGGAASSKLSSFASPAGSSFAAPSSPDKKPVPSTSVFGSSSSGGFASLGLSDKPAKPFGAPGEAKKDKEDDADEDSEPSTPAAHITTGEEDETAAWSGRAKIYVLEGEKDKKAWKERGNGTLKLNVKDDDEGTRKLRLVLRVEGTHRVALNVGITKAMKFGTIEGKCPLDGKIMFSVPLKEDEIASYILRMKGPLAEDLWKSVKKLQDEL